MGLTKRLVKGRPLTFAEGDANLDYLESLSSSSSISLQGSTIYTSGPVVGTTGFNVDNSILLGSNAGKDAAQAAKSYFIGYNAGNGATYANDSVFIGSYTGYNAANTQRSIFLGYYAGNGAQNAANSILIGYKAGQAVSGSTIGGNNIIIGNNITLRNAVSNSINLGGVLFASGINSVLGGNPTSGSVNGKVGINNPDPTHNLDVSGSGRFVGTFILTGSLDLFTNTSSYNYVRIGSVKINNGSGSVRNNLSISTANYPSEVTYGLGEISTGTTGDWNTAVGGGNGIMRRITTGRANTAVGGQTLDWTSVGSNNTGLGVQALIYNTSGSSNTAVGSGAGVYLRYSGDYNVFLGAYSSIDPNQPAANNFAQGSYNTFLGAATWYGILTGSNNTLIGARIGGLSSSLDNTVIIADGSGNQRIVVDATGSMTIGKILTLAISDPLPTVSVPTGSFAVSGSGANNKPYYWNGSTWTPLF
jgi:hypothetical protein